MSSSQVLTCSSQLDRVYQRLDQLSKLTEIRITKRNQVYRSPLYISERLSLPKPVTFTNCTIQTLYNSKPHTPCTLISMHAWACFGSFFFQVHMGSLCLMVYKNLFHKAETSELKYK
ncbi:hypothetical protein SK128_011313 [Halocaridina rubra]|uniref:Uncharacterized protein n=1 Tax=Halocaridina rubra TaxID=373956 RepID=A0AAN8XUD9_HALRR